jgi:inner membrane protein
MDTPTQALLGAVVGQACFSRKLGKRALWWGALGGAIPDLDVISVAFAGPWAEFLYHRGPTHALWFGPVAGSLLGYAVWRWYARKREDVAGSEEEIEVAAADKGLPLPGDPALLGAWVGLFVLTFLSQPFLDVFTTYGTQLFAPFSNRRFALDAVPIIDPVYSLILIAALAVWTGTTAERRVRVGRRAATLALVLSTAYLFYGLWLNERAGDEVRRQLAAEGITNARVHVYPTIFQVYLRRVVVRSEDEVLVGAITMWNPGTVVWRRFTVPNHPMIMKLAETREGRIFDWFASGQVVPRVIEMKSGFVVEFEDLRYGFFEEPEHGIWGIRGKFDMEGNLMGNVVRFQRDFSVRLETFLDLWRATFGLTPEAPRLGLPEGWRGQGAEPGNKLVSEES